MLKHLSESYPVSANTVINKSNIIFCMVWTCANYNSYIKSWAQFCSKMWGDSLVWNQYITKPKEKNVELSEKVGGTRTPCPHLIASMHQICVINFSSNSASVQTLSKKQLPLVSHSNNGCGTHAYASFAWNSESSLVNSSSREHWQQFWTGLGKNFNRNVFVIRFKLTTLYLYIRRRYPESLGGGSPFIVACLDTEV